MKAVGVFRAVWVRSLVACALICASLFGGVAETRADSVLVTLTTTGGLLTETAVPAAVATGTIGGSASYSLSIAVSDLTGSNNGWNLTVTSTHFAPVSGAAFPATASQVTGVTSACTLVLGCTAATNGITYPFTLPAGATAPTAVKLYNATANTGEGLTTVTPAVSVAVPATANAVAYTSTITLSIVSGP